MPLKNMLKQENGNEGKQILVYQYTRMHNRGIELRFQSHGDLLWKKTQVFEHMQSVNKCICAIIIISTTH